MKKRESQGDGESQGDEESRQEYWKLGIQEGERWQM